MEFVIGVWVLVGILLLIVGVCSMFKKKQVSYLSGLTDEQMRSVSKVKNGGGDYVKLCNYYKVLNADDRYGRVVGLNGKVEHEGFGTKTK